MRKKSPQEIHLEKMLRSSKLVSEGFMGDDERDLYEIIDADAHAVAELGRTTAELAERMREVTKAAVPALGNWVDVDDKRRAKVDEAKGVVICPWPEPGRFAKRVTTVQNSSTGESIYYSDLNVHLIEAHGFFEGKGSRFRMEPEKLVRILFD